MCLLKKTHKHIHLMNIKLFSRNTEMMSESIEKQLGDAWDIYLENQSEQSLAINWKQQGIDLKDYLKSIGNLPGCTSYLSWTNQVDFKNLLGIAFQLTSRNDQELTSRIDWDLTCTDVTSDDLGWPRTTSGNLRRPQSWEFIENWPWLEWYLLGIT